MSIEPPAKKSKLHCDTYLDIQNLENYIQTVKLSSKPLKIILSDNISNPIPLVNMYIGHIKDPRLMSTTILLLNKHIPLTSFQHLKRVKGRSILLCPVNFLNGTSIQKYLEENIPDLNDIFEYFKEVSVPSQPPKVIAQYKEANKIWSVNFHPNKYLESVVNNTLFDDEQLRNHREIMAMTFEVAKWYISRQELQSGIDASDINVAIIFDPVVSSVVAIAVDNRKRHPMQHAAMLAIDNVAKTQNAGAWLSDEEKLVSDRKHSGIDKELLSHLYQRFSTVKFGARPFKKRSSETEDKDVCEGPYLCTGYYIYLLKEPCVMCTMGLIHARINRAFFCFDNKDHGALQSRTMLHLNPSLNHRFEAFTGFL